MAKLLIKELCKQQGIPLKLMAEKMGMSASTFTQFLNSPNPSIPTLERIAEVLKVNVGDLFGQKYKRVTGFVATDNESVTIKSKEDWVKASKFIDGLVKVPLYVDLEAFRKDVDRFVRHTAEGEKCASFWAQLGAERIISLTAIFRGGEYCEECGNEFPQYTEYCLISCTGEGDIAVPYVLSTLEYNGDLDGLISEICNTAESVYEDKDYGENIS